MIHPPVCGSADRDSLEIEPSCDVPRESGHGVLAVGRQQDVATQIEQPRHFAPAVHRFTGPVLRRRRQLAGDDGGDDERDQGHPVLRVGNRERADRRQKKIVQDQRRGNRGHDRHQQTRKRSGAEHDEQQRQRHRRRIPDPEHPADQVHRCGKRAERQREIASGSRPGHGHCGHATSLMFF